MSKKVKRIRIGDKEYSLNDIWRLCRKMWADIKDESNITKAKHAWLEKHGFMTNDITACCFFCEWGKVCDPDDHCNACPGKMVNSWFGCCNKTYHYYSKPRKFEAKIKVLDLKRVH